jgi:hypothetical protein
VLASELLAQAPEKAFERVELKGALHRAHASALHELERLARPAARDLVQAVSLTG